MADPTTPNPKEPDHGAILAELVSLGLDLTRRVHAAAPAPNPRPTPEDCDALAAATLAFDRIARTVRRTIRLADHLARLPAPAPAPADAATRRANARKHVIRAVENAAAREHRTPAQAESLRTELLERLDAPEGEHDLATRPLHLVLADILRDLHLEAPATFWKRRRPADLAALHAAAAGGHPPPRTPAPLAGPAPPPSHPRPSRPNLTGLWLQEPLTSVGQYSLR